jgi:hypothetical protein
MGTPAQSDHLDLIGAELSESGAPLLGRLAAAAYTLANPGARERCLADQTPPRLGFGVRLDFGLLVHVLSS